jgi:hypothetical protein
MVNVLLLALTVVLIGLVFALWSPPTHDIFHDSHTSGADFSLSISSVSSFVVSVFSALKVLLLTSMSSLRRLSSPCHHRWSLHRVGLCFVGVVFACACVLSVRIFRPFHWWGHGSRGRGSSGPPSGVDQIEEFIPGGEYRYRQKVEPMDFPTPKCRPRIGGGGARIVKPGEPIFDDRGNVIHAHGGGFIVPHQVPPFFSFCFSVEGTRTRPGTFCPSSSCAHNKP